MNANLLQLLESNNVDVQDFDKITQLIVEKCSRIAMEQSRSTDFASYDELDDYDRGCDDTASIISSRIKDYFSK